MIKIILVSASIFVVVLIIVVLGAIFWATNNRNSGEESIICQYSKMENCRLLKTVKVLKETDNTLISIDIYEGNISSETYQKAFLIDTSTTENRKISFIGDFEFLDASIPYKFMFFDFKGENYYLVLSKDEASKNKTVTVTLRGNKVNPSQDDMHYMRGVELKDGIGYRPLEKTFTSVEAILIYYSSSKDFAYNVELPSPFYISYKSLDNYIN